MCILAQSPIYLGHIQDANPETDSSSVEASITRSPRQAKIVNKKRTTAAAAVREAI